MNEAPDNFIHEFSCIVFAEISLYVECMLQSDFLMDFS